MNEVSYTTEEVAKLLKVSKLTVYDLIKKGELPAYRVGKQMRVDADDLEMYKQNAKSGNGAHGAIRAQGKPQTSERTVSHPQEFRGEVLNLPGQTQIPGTLVITGQDLSLDVLAKHLERANPSLRPLRSHDGSLDSLISMYHGKSDIVSTHLLDGISGEYNIPYITKILTGHSYVVVNLLQRQAGLYVRQGNPKQLKTWADLGTPGIRLINREIGSGARVLLDEQLRAHGIDRSGIEGYNDVENSHLAVAGKVSSGQADVGVGIENAVSLISTVDFVPLIKERYDLVVLKSKHNAAWIQLLLQTLQSPEFQQELSSIRGYDLTLTGTILYDTEGENAPIKR
ncbi:substrate-binding domain-containing protein [Fontibacillus sp. BL9]|uniref:substrate-binding domain-containing protein n=1 Tax=Fontibacillus sp. BL9 TaxID=3389971 RepID=UPI00397B2007